jgi:hypothetical protein
MNLFLNRSKITVTCILIVAFISSCTEKKERESNNNTEWNRLVFHENTRSLIDSYQKKIPEEYKEGEYPLLVLVTFFMNKNGDTIMKIASDYFEPYFIDTSIHLKGIYLKSPYPIAFSSNQDLDKWFIRKKMLSMDRKFKRPEHIFMETPYFEGGVFKNYKLVGKKWESLSK